MRQTKVGKVRRWGMAAALAALAGGTGVANGAVIVATWDPAYGPGIPGLAFTGEAQFYVPDGCLTGPNLLSPTFIADGSACSTGDPNGAGISLRSAFVDLYTFSGTYSTLTRTFQERLTYATPVGLYGSTVTPDPLLGVVVQYDSGTGQNEVVGASSFLFGPVAPTDPDITAILGSFDAFFMRLGPGLPAPTDGASLPGAAADPYRFSSLFACGYDGPDCFIPENPNAQSTLAPVVFARAPEPGSLALVLGALAAGWAARRSRRPVEPVFC